MALVSALLFLLAEFRQLARVFERMGTRQMDLIDRLKQIATRVPTKLDHLQTEEATKNALVMPFIQAMGYDVFNPAEVVPEFTADVGTKKGEKVDYAVLRDGTPIILFECKKAGVDLDELHASQLYRYFSVTTARFGVLTNGVDYKVFSDLEEPNKMDSKPFLEFRLVDVTETVAHELKKFMKESFDIDNILATASELKYTKGIKRFLAEEWVNPSDELVRIMASRVYTGRMTQAARDQFAQITKKALHQFVNDRVNERLKLALEGERATLDGADTNPDEGKDEEASGVDTTVEELEGFYVVKSIVREVVDVRRVFMRDTRTYCGVILDDNNRKPLCRLWFNSPRKHLGLFDEKKKETRHRIDDVNGIYAFSEQLKKGALRYDEATPHDTLQGDAVEAPEDLRQ